MTQLYGRNQKLFKVEPSHYEGGVPVFTPMMKEFQDFYTYQRSINQYGMESGIVKVIPPQEWTNSLSKTPELLSQVRFHKPITQQISGSGGKFHIQNLEKQKSYNLMQWKKLSYQPNFALPLPRGEFTEQKEMSEEDKNSFADLKTNAPVEAFQNFAYNIDTSIYSADRCKFLEQHYWKTLSFSTPFYGADSRGSLFSDNCKTWNVAHLPNLLDNLPETLPGVNDAYLYGGLWKATFSWHLEDQDLHSINYIHFGAPKQWYSISQSQHQKFYKVMSDIFAEDHNACKEFLRHKTFLVSPQVLSKHGITVNKIVHRENEFIITYPYGYHSGFNCGYNVAESVNFALEEWLEIGLKSKKCECIHDSVGIDVMGLVKRLKGDFVSQQCCLCPIDLPKYYTGIEGFELLSLPNGTKAHRLCAELIPELSVEHGQVHGLSQIPKARRDLKCCYCSRERRLSCMSSACFQCDHSTCTRAFHGTCALMAGVDLKPTGKYCRYHRSPTEMTEPLKRSSYDEGGFLQFVVNGSSYCGEVVFNSESENSVKVVVFPFRGTQYENVNCLEVEYASLLGRLEIANLRIKQDESQEVQPPAATQTVSDDWEIQLYDPQFVSAEPREPFCIWYYRPLVSSELVGRYSNDARSAEPNDASYLKYKERKEAKMKREAKKQAMDADKRQKMAFVPFHFALTPNRV